LFDSWHQTSAGDRREANPESESTILCDREQ